MTNIGEDIALREFIAKLHPIGRILLYIQEHDRIGRKECWVGDCDRPGEVYLMLTRRGFDLTEEDGGFHIRW